MQEEFGVETPATKEGGGKRSIDVSNFKPITCDDLVKVLGLTIKRDETNKIITFLAQLSAFTEDSQLNISFNAPSSTGKSFIPTEIASLFPEEDVIEVGYCSPTAFFHDVGVFDQDKGGYIVNLSRKILIFLDQPHTLLLQHLRPILSHDKKEIRLKITDKSQKYGLKTKNIFVIGYPAVTFCTAGLRLDEQEATRFLLLSPEIDQEKIREAIYARVARDSNNSEFQALLDSDPKRKDLKERILAIKEAHIGEIRIGNPRLLTSMFFANLKSLKPRHQRDVARVINLIKTIALLNIWSRKVEDGVLISNDSDIKTAFKVWGLVSESQELNLPPYVYNLFKDVISKAYAQKNSELSGGVTFGVTRQDILKAHFEVYSRHLADWQLRQEIIPMLENSGLIYQEPDINDKRRLLIYPTTSLTISQDEKSDIADPFNGKEPTKDEFVEGIMEVIEKSEGK